MVWASDVVILVSGINGGRISETLVRFVTLQCTATRTDRVTASLNFNQLFMTHKKETLMVRWIGNTHTHNIGLAYISEILHDFYTETGRNILGLLNVRNI